MSIPLGKALSLFQQSVNTKVEPVLQYDWIHKLNSKKKLEDLEDLYHNLSKASQNAMIVKLEWNRIDINNEFLMYILTLPCLRDLSICHCHVSDESIRLSLLSEIVSKLPLEKLSLRRTFRNEHGLLRELRQSLISNKTLQSLDVSDLAIGDVGIAILQDVVSNSSSLSSINFDKSDGMDVGVLIDMFNTLAAIPRITKVTKPRHDIQVISSEHSRKTAQEIRSAWGRLSSAMKKRSRNDDESTELDPESSIAANSQSSASPAKLNIPRANTTNVSWNVDGEPQVPNMATEWEAMKSRFSYPNLTGLPVISISDNLNFSL
ncbi:hypothetical protein TVAG_067390 [Trichomonas vaginalis G3]|uniref:Leucine Rich Repeat family protein n=1 Tax=Trichomonas vaginalis (strain ATCC PRA-98 / G3) TaxID=412133 RepID=A2DSF5_TRIV3|nr:RNI-like family [Trichomonas vaginalis G3]EAY16734.1 hypothetical protein TVAG_067390 [Trichomonas vaginalis G3]KAI5543175.1 RNI-like family [Trichomonas vaginalis G3]|eukprot:XP_001328957.1 hypothetical protein [Trichomonas vaginalis G3]